jgi:hypothetical protein
MKKLLIIAFVLLAQRTFAQKDTIGVNVPFVNNTVVYERVFDAPNVPENLLYSNAGLWLAETHPYVADTQLTLQDPAISRVVGRISSYVSASHKVLWETQYYTYHFTFTVQIDCKDNKYRVRIFNIQDVVNNTTHAPIDDMMVALINSKSYTLDNGDVMKKADFQKCFQGLNTVVSNVMADINRSVIADNGF